MGLIVSASTAATAANVDAIFEHMARLRPLIGTWKAAIDFHGRDGSVSPETADYVVRPVLDGTYLEWDVTVYPASDPGKPHSFMIMTTYNPETQKYDQTYFYSRQAMRVTETGDFDDVRHEYNTVAFVPREDGVRDESVRTVTRFRDDGRVEYWHYSRYSDEKLDLMNFHATLTRVR
ncbi:MAG: DUF1579 family protein [Rhizomicrobium sp.]|jgi:hypothetical protein